MNINISVWAQDEKKESDWTLQLKKSLSANLEVKFTNKSAAQILFIDAKVNDIDQKLVNFERDNRFVILVVSETDNEVLPSQFDNGLVDDVIVVPFRKIEILGKLHHFHQVSMWSEVEKANQGIENVMGRLREDLELAQRLQTTTSPNRFDDLTGIKVNSRYLAGLKAGGDYVDVIPSESAMDLSIFMSDSSSYGLSSAVLSVLMKVAIRLSSESGASCVSTMRRIYSELMSTLKERDHLSFFYGNLNKKDWTLKYTAAGSTHAWVAAKGDTFRMLEFREAPLSRSSGVNGIDEFRLQLSPDDRLAILSDGFIDAVGGVEKSHQLLNEFRSKDGKEVLNEFTFAIKRHLKDEDAMPNQDATGLIIDIPSNVLRLM